jgi:hypothetical protein
MEEKDDGNRYLVTMSPELACKDLLLHADDYDDNRYIKYYAVQYLYS